MTYCLIAYQGLLNWRREELVREEIQRTRHHNSGIVSSLQCCNQDCVFADRMGVLVSKKVTEHVFDTEKRKKEITSSIGESGL